MVTQVTSEMVGLKVSASRLTTECGISVKVATSWWAQPPDTVVKKGDGRESNQNVNVSFL